jgi:hypothetical protein
VTDLETLESAIALDELAPIAPGIITPCLAGIDDAEFAGHAQPWDLALCPNIAVLHRTAGTPAQRRPMCISHAIAVARALPARPHRFTCGAPTAPGYCCTVGVTSDDPCSEHGPQPLPAHTPATLDAVAA